MKDIPGKLTVEAMKALYAPISGNLEDDMAYARKVDENQRQIVKDLRLAGFSVMITSGLGDDYPDLVVGRWGVDRQVEIKRPAGPRGGTAMRNLSEGQERHAREWGGAPVILARSALDVLEAFKAVGR